MFIPIKSIGTNRLAFLYGLYGLCHPLFFEVSNVSSETKLCSMVIMIVVLMLELCEEEDKYLQSN